jgi:hypothetical protein
MRDVQRVSVIDGQVKGRPPPRVLKRCVCCVRVEGVLEKGGMCGGERAHWRRPSPPPPIYMLLTTWWLSVSECLTPPQCHYPQSARVPPLITFWDLSYFLNTRLYVSTNRFVPTYSPPPPLRNPRHFLEVGTIILVPDSGKLYLT